MNTLHEIGLKHGTDKATFHDFCRFYATNFDHLRNEPIRFLEIGVWQSASMKMWLEYFPNAEIHGIDYIPNTVPEGAHFHQVNCENEEQLKQFAATCGLFDIIIDDGGHTMLQQQLAFKHLWSKCKKFYVIEDIHTSFMPYLRRCNHEGWPLTIELLSALQNNTKFNSPALSEDFTEAVKQETKQVKIFGKTWIDEKTSAIFSNSLTSLIERKIII